MVYILMNCKRRVAKQFEVIITSYYVIMSYNSGYSIAGRILEMEFKILNEEAPMEICDYPNSFRILNCRNDIENEVRNTK